MKSKLLLVDFSNILMRGLSMNDGLEDSQGRFTGGVYGFLIMLAARIREHRPKAVIVCLDVKPYFREELYQNYKGDRPSRNKKEEDPTRVPLSELREQSKELCVELLDLLNIPVAGKKGYEADDMIAHFVSEFYNDFDEILIDSNDSDLYQLLDEDEKIACLSKNKLYKNSDFLAQWDGISKEQLITALALTGTHNAVVGVKGIGVKTALKIVKSSKLLCETRDRHEELITKNEKLIALPWEGLDGYAPENILVSGFDQRKLSNFLAQYDIKLTEKMVDAFEWLGETVHDLI